MLRTGARKTAPRATGKEALRDEILGRLPFEAEIMICPARDIVGLVRSEPFGPGPAKKDLRRFVSVMDKSPRTSPPLPIDRPVGDEWQVRVTAIAGRYALSLWRLLGRRVVYPNEVVEKSLGVSATTRGWDTMATICNILEKG